MKLYFGLLLVALSMPLASLAGGCALEFEVVWNIRQALGVGVVVGLAMILLALIMFFCGIPSTLQRLRAQTSISN